MRDKNTINKTNKISVIFLSEGSYSFVKEKHVKGIYWTINKDNKYLLIDYRTNSSKESSFDSLDELQNFCERRLK